MRRLMIAGLFMGLVSVSYAAQYDGNPDRMPSIGLNYQGVALSGDLTVTDTGVSAKQNSETTTGSLVLDLRLPVSDYITLNAALGTAAGTSTADETKLLAGGKSDESGLLLNFGVRFYIH